MGTYLLITPREDELYHFGIKGMKWGIRRFQNKDGSRTAAGKKRASASGANQGWDGKAAKKAAQDYSKKHGITDPEMQELIEMDYRDNGPDAMSKYGGSTFTKDLGKEDALDRADYLSKSRGLKLNDKEHEELLGIKATLAKDPIKGAKDLQAFEDKLGTRKNGVVLTNDDQKKLRTAVVEDQYELDFLEAIQNEEWEYNNDKKRRDSEYEQYLLDRNKYMTAQHSQQYSDELYHYGVKGMKWHQHKSLGNSVGGATIGMGGGAVEISETEREINQAENAADSYDQMASAIERRMKLGDKKTLFHTLVLRRGSSEARAKAERGRRKVQEIREYAKKAGLQFQHADYSDELISVMNATPDDLMHFGIKGMKWGIRRFQPYQKGEHVKGGKEVGAATKVKQRPSSGNIIERYKAHKTKQKRVAALKKAQATRKAKADFEAEKKKAVESGSIEDLAKFKGKLTNEEYNRAFARLQNEQKVAALVQANQKTVWDKVDKGMEIVARVSKYANVVTTAKNNFDALDEALHKKERNAEEEKKAAEKNKFLTNIDNITELNEGVEKHKITPKEYQAAMNILANKKMNRARFADMGEGGDFEDQNKKAAKEQAERDRADRAKWGAEQNWKQYQKRQEKEAKKAWKEYQKKAKKAADEPKDGEWWEDNSSSKAKSSSSSSEEPKTTPNANSKPATQLLLSMRDSKPSESAVNSGKRVISGAKTGNAGTTYKQQTNLDFGGSKVSRFSAKAPTPSKVVTDTRQTVANTQAERARQKEADKKRKKALGHSAIDGSDELYHHGIKGQKWGVRRFQDKNGRRTAAGIERAKKRRLLDSKDTITEGRSYVEKSTFSYKVDLDTYEAERRVMPDGSYVYPAIATVIKTLEETGAGNPYPGPKGFDGLYDRVNPGYGEPGTTNNCPFVAATMEIASRGYGVVARRSLGGTSVGVFRHWFKGADTQKCDTWDEMSSDLKGMEDGASGVMQGYYGDGLGSGCGGHSLHWRKEGGRVIVADGQSHKEMDFDEVQSSYGFGSNGCFFTRLDKCEPNWDALAEDGVLGVNDSERRMVSKPSSDTVLPNKAWNSTEFYGYSDVQGYKK